MNNDHKICFICCSNNPQYEAEFRFYLGRLRVPPGMQMEIKMVYGAQSMTGGYQQAMEESDAKYKVYLHQDVFLVNIEFIYDILRIFHNPAIGMVGMMGALWIPRNGIVYNASNYGRLDTSNSNRAFEIVGLVEQDVMPVQSVDGLLIATQYDLPWREDLFDGWDFYDISQAIEFRKQGYQVVVPYQEDSWCVHDDGYQNLSHYDRARQIFLKEYREFCAGDIQDETLKSVPELWNITMEAKANLLGMFDAGNYAEIYAFLCENYEKLSEETELTELRNVLEIWSEEQRLGWEDGFLKEGACWKDVQSAYTHLKFLIRRLEYQLEGGEEAMRSYVETTGVSAAAMIVIVMHYVIRQPEVLLCLARLCRTAGRGDDADWMEQVAASLGRAEDSEDGAGGCDSKKISFILCANQPQYQKECTAYIEELKLPEGYRMEIIPVVGAKSMTEGYNIGMRRSNAKYKVYLHQDVLIWNRNFIFDILHVFCADSAIGMIGVLGCDKLPENGKAYLAWNVGGVYACNTEDLVIYKGKNIGLGTVCDVQAVDGMLMATQYDLPWREDLFDGWDFYDVSQSLEFRRETYRIVVPYQHTPWCMHDCGRSKLFGYDRGRKILLQEYQEFFHNSVYRAEDDAFDEGEHQGYAEMRHLLIQAMESGHLTRAEQICGQYDDAEINDSHLSVLKKLMTICMQEQQIYGQIRTWRQGEAYQTVLERYNEVKFLLWDVWRRRNHAQQRLEKALAQELYSMPLVVTAGVHNMKDFDRLLPVLRAAADGRRNEKEQAYVSEMEQELQFHNLGYTDETVFCSEEEIAKMERQTLEQEVIKREEWPVVRGQLNQFLRDEKWPELFAVLSSEEFCGRYRFVPEMSYLLLAASVYRAELAESVSVTVLNGRASVEEIAFAFRELRFCLWRLEFELEGAEHAFLEWVEKNRASAVFLRYGVQVAGMEKAGLLRRMAALFLGHGSPGMALAMLNAAIQLQPGNEAILCMMAEVCLRAGENIKALYCLDMVQYPTQMTASYRKMCEG